MDSLFDNPSMEALQFDEIDNSSQSFEESIDALLNLPQTQDFSSSLKKSPVDGTTSTSALHMMNAVHMEVQENAKIPNTYNIPLTASRNRTKSLDVKREGLVDDIMRFDEVDWNLTETFLGNNERCVIIIFCKGYL